MNELFQKQSAPDDNMVYLFFFFLVIVAIAECFYCCFVWGFVLLSQGLTVESGYLGHMIIPRLCLSSAKITGINHHAWLKIWH